MGVEVTAMVAVEAEGAIGGAIKIKTGAVASFMISSSPEEVINQGTITTEAEVAGVWLEISTTVARLPETPKLHPNIGLSSLGYAYFSLILDVD